MTAEMLQTALLIANGVVIVLLPMMLLWVGGRIRNSVRESTKRALAEYSARHQESLAASNARSQRDAREPGLFTQKQQDVYARLYARYRRASDGFRAMIERATDPDFRAFSRDDLLKYLRIHQARERDAADAIAALDRGDTFAMARLMSRLHDRISYRNANTALNRAKEFEAMNELYLSDAVRQAVKGARDSIDAVSVALMRSEEQQRDAARQSKTKDAMDVEIGRLLRVMRDELRGSGSSVGSAERERPVEIPILAADAPPRQHSSPGFRAPANQRVQ